MTSAEMTSGGMPLNDGARTWRYPPGSTVAVPADQPFPIIGLDRIGPNAIAYSADLRRKDPTIRTWFTDDGVHRQPVDWR